MGRNDTDARTNPTAVRAHQTGMVTVGVEENNGPAWHEYDKHTLRDKLLPRLDKGSNVIGGRETPRRRNGQRLGDTADAPAEALRSCCQTGFLLSYFR